MNSLGILSGISSTPNTPPRSRAASEGNILDPQPRSESRESRRRKTEDAGISDTELLSEKRDTPDMAQEEEIPPNESREREAAVNEKTPLLAEPEDTGTPEKQKRSIWVIPQRLANGVVTAMKVVVSTLISPGRYIVACFYDDQGHFSAVMPLYRVSRAMFRKRRKPSTQDATLLEKAKAREGTQDRAARKGTTRTSSKRLSKKPTSAAFSSAALTSDSELDNERQEDDSPARHTRSRSSLSTSGEEIAPGKKTIRIKLRNDELREKKRRPLQRSPTKMPSSTTEEVAARLKSPTSPAGTSVQLTKFPRAPAPPRPLVPRRQPSYAPGGMGSSQHQKTLVLDLDETLIHSMAKGGRYTTGHMVEVKLNQPMGAGGTAIGPQIPILYYVHKRPHCDEFLRKVSKWYKLVIFTASVQEYADPVIDWLEMERKYFSARLYRQHCTQRNGAYIKDLGVVEGDLSKVMIVDNSPVSYVFHEDNAVPIEGWISDPTDNELRHLIPLLEGLQYVTDVRALLALRLGEPQTP